MTNAVSKIERVADGGNLLRNLDWIVLDTWQTSQEVFKDWQSGEPVQGVNTANLAIYRLVNGKPVLGLLRKEGNLFMDDRFRKRLYDGIISQEFFVLPDDMLSHVIPVVSGGKVVEVPYKRLDVITKQCDKNYGYVKVSDNNNADEKRLIAGVYGVESPGNGKKIYLLRPNIVKDVLKGAPQGAVARACYFYGNQNFDADDRDFSIADSAVRGVRLSRTAEGGALDNAYATVLAGVKNMPDSRVLELYQILHPSVMEIASRNKQQ